MCHVNLGEIVNKLSPVLQLHIALALHMQMTKSDHTYCITQ